MTFPVAAFDNLSPVQQSQLGCLLFDFTHPLAFDFYQRLPQNLAQIIIYCHVTIQFLPCLN